nr:hypothetical protein 8 [bacterium]
MKKRFGIIGLIAMLAMLFCVVPAIAADSIFCKFMTGDANNGKDLGTTYHYGAYVAIPGDNNSQVVVTSFSGTSDTDTSTCNAYVYDKENSATINSACNAGSAELGIASGGASFDANDIIVLQDASGSTIYVETVASTGATTIALNGLTDGAIAATGWTVYEMEKIGEIPVGNATTSYESDVAVVAGPSNSPVLIWLGGDAACSINFASGHYK